MRLLLCSARASAEGCSRAPGRSLEWPRPAACTAGNDRTSPAVLPTAPEVRDASQLHTSSNTRAHETGSQPRACKPKTPAHDGSPPGTDGASGGSAHRGQAREWPSQRKTKRRHGLRASSRRQAEQWVRATSATRLTPRRGALNVLAAAGAATGRERTGEHDSRALRHRRLPTVPGPPPHPATDAPCKSKNARARHYEPPDWARARRSSTTASAASSSVQHLLVLWRLPSGALKLPNHRFKVLS